MFHNPAPCCGILLNRYRSEWWEHELTEKVQLLYIITITKWAIKALPIEKQKSANYLANYNPLNIPHAVIYQNKE